MKNLLVLIMAIVFPVAVIAADGAATNSAINGTNGSKTTDGSMSSANAAAKGDATADRNLEKSILMNLVNDSRLTKSLNGVRISANDGRVTLEGTVASEEEKMSYTNQVEGVIGVDTVDNRLQVSQGSR